MLAFKFKFHFITLLVVLATLVAVSACSKKTPPIKPESEMYADSVKAMDRGRYEVAVERYDQLLTAYPYGQFSTQASIDLCYAHYKTREFERALPCIDEFISTHPTHANVDYAYYLKGLVLLPVRPPKLGQRFFRSHSSLTDHDAETGREAFAAFSRVTERFPLSQYAEASRRHMVDLINIFARHDLQIAQYYMRRQAYVGAINRASSILTRFETSQFTEEALAILVYCYTKLELQDLAQDNLRVLVHNFPDSIYLTDSQAIFDRDILEPELLETDQEEQ